MAKTSQKLSQKSLKESVEPMTKSENVKANECQENTKMNPNFKSKK
jgi:hypothetical protein